MNRPFKIIVYTMLFLFNFSISKAQEKANQNERQEIFSNILHEKREIWVHLPKSYNNSAISPAQYPVIYLLDAEINFEYYTPMVDFLSRSPYADIPECIVVGIVNTERTRDFTPTKSSKKNPINPAQVLFENSGGSADFLRFIKEELKPFVNKNYRTLDYSILAGHSFGGVFVIDTLLEAPETFNGYVANDPSIWWDHEVLVKKADDYLKKNKDFPEQLFLYLSQADNEGQGTKWDADMGGAVRRFKEVIGKSKALNFEHHFYKGEQHGTVSYPANYYALKFIFKGFRTDIKLFSGQPQKLEREYAEFSKNRGFTFIPSETYLNVIIKFMKNNNSKEQETYFNQLKEKLYPSGKVLSK
ncbi:alpha/beta hydrolase [Chryseobacterium sp. CT-SW4]|uniref:alpha/beta hydrolase n=1 Tax=Chryseobacterium sp. SW-1 TaxID=3157343 RepID=UPI003B023DB8